MDVAQLVGIHELEGIDRRGAGGLNPFLLLLGSLAMDLLLGVSLEHLRRLYLYNLAFFILLGFLRVSLRYGMVG